MRSERRILDFGFVPAPPRVRNVLGVATVLEVRRLNLADGEPFARVTVWCPEELGAHLSARRCRAGVVLRAASTSRSVARCRRSARRWSTLAMPWCSRCPRVAVLRCERITSDPDGRPVLLSEHIFPAHRTEFVVDLPLAEASIAATGLRLVE